MQKELEQNRLDALIMCDRLLTALEENREEAHAFFAGELYQAYDTATEEAKEKVRAIKRKLRNL